MFCTNDINFEEKLIQIKKVINLNEYNEIYAYGDSDGDKKMLEIATKSFYKYFN
jgi:phosphoserine phosphatase